MKQVILKTTLFLVILLALIISLLVGSNTRLKKNGFVGIDQRASYIVLGHSHPETAFNDSLISDFDNCSCSGEASFYTYFKAKKIIGDNENIKVVLIEFTNNQIDKRMNEWIWDTEHLAARYPHYAPFLEFKDHRLLFQNNLSGFTGALSLSLNRNINKIVYDNYDYTSIRNGYRGLNGSRIDSFLNVSMSSQRPVNFNQDISVENLKYLQATIEYCIDAGKKVFLIRSPVHEKWPELQNEELFKKCKNDLIQKTDHKIEFLDFKDFPLTNAEFYDVEHLNSSGARAFSIWFESLVLHGLLKIDDKQNFIDQKIKEAQIRLR
jgi:hypothetical protein